MEKNTSSVISALLLVGSAIWAVPLAWYYKQKKNNKKINAKGREFFSSFCNLFSVFWVLRKRDIIQFDVCSAQIEINIDVPK